MPKTPGAILVKIETNSTYTEALANVTEHFTLKTDSTLVHTTPSFSLFRPW